MRKAPNPPKNSRPSVPPAPPSKRYINEDPLWVQKIMKVLSIKSKWRVNRVETKKRIERVLKSLCDCSITVIKTGAAILIMPLWAPFFIFNNRFYEWIIDKIGTDIEELKGPTPIKRIPPPSGGSGISLKAMSNKDRIISLAVFRADLLKEQNAGKRDNSKEIAALTTMIDTL